MYAKSDDHELVKIGNPYLRPQFTQSAEVSYKTDWTGCSVYVSAYYRNIKDAYMRIYVPDASNTDFNVLVKSYANTGRAENLSMELVFNQVITKSWKLSGNLNVYQNDIKAYTGTILFPYEQTFTISPSAETTWDAKIINTFNLGQGLQGQLTGLYIAPKNTPQGKQFARSSVDFGFKKNIWQGKGELNLAVTDIFNRFGIKEEINGDGFRAIYENFYETQTVRLGLKYKF